MLTRDQRWAIMAAVTEHGAFAGFAATGVFAMLATILLGDTSQNLLLRMLGGALAGLVAGVVNGALFGALFAWAVSAAVVGLDDPTLASAILNGVAIHVAPVAMILATLLARVPWPQVAPGTQAAIVAGGAAFVALGAWFGWRTWRALRCLKPVAAR